MGDRIQGFIEVLSRVFGCRDYGRIRKSRVCSVDLHEFVSGQVFSVDGRHIGLANSDHSPVRGLDFLVRGAGGDAKDIVRRRARGVKIRRSRLLHPGIASFNSGEGDYWPGFDAARRRSHGVAEEVNDGKRERTRKKSCLLLAILGACDTLWLGEVEI
ncbi:hypothetical protein JHK87_050263 [Glycine soja]|nr:hypothetical protein JHK87_050263 [Glycine soja]